MVRCGCDDCKHWENGYCEKEDIDVMYVMSASGLKPQCVDYEEWEDEESKE